MEFLHNFHSENEPLLANETRKAIVNVLGSQKQIVEVADENSNEISTGVIDQALHEVVPEIFPKKSEQPPYKSILDEYFKKTMKLLHEQGIKEIEIQLPCTPSDYGTFHFVLHHTDNPYVIYLESDPFKKLDFSYYENFIYIFHEIDEGFDFDCEINMDIIKWITEGFNEELVKELKRKREERKEYWESDS